MPDEPSPRSGPDYIRGEEWRRRRARRDRRLRLVLLSTAALLALGGAVRRLIPPHLAAKQLQRTVQAQAKAPGVHVVSLRLAPDRRATPFAEEWVSGETWRIERKDLGVTYRHQPGHSEVLYRGTVLRSGSPLDTYVASPQPVARQALFLLWSLARSKERTSVEAQARETFGGRDCARLLVHAPSYRHLLWLDRQTDRVVGLRSLRKDHRGWVPVLEHRFRYDVSPPPSTPAKISVSPAQAIARRDSLFGQTIHRWTVGGKTVRLHAVETNEQGDLFLLIAGDRNLASPEVIDDGGTLYQPTYYSTSAHGDAQKTVRLYVPLVRSQQPRRRVLSISMPGSKPAGSVARLAAPRPRFFLVPAYTASPFGWEDLEWLYRHARAQERAEGLHLALREQSVRERRQMLEHVPGSRSVPRDAAHSPVALEEYEGLLATIDERALADGSASLLYEEWVDVYRHLKTLGRREEALRALRLALEVFQRPGRAPARTPELGFEEALQEEGLPLPPPSES